MYWQASRLEDLIAYLNPPAFLTGCGTHPHGVVHSGAAVSWCAGRPAAPQWQEESFQRKTGCNPVALIKAFGSWRDERSCMNEIYHRASLVCLLWNKTHYSLHLCKRCFENALVLLLPSKKSPKLKVLQKK